MQRQNVVLTSRGDAGPRAGGRGDGLARPVAVPLRAGIGLAAGGAGLDLGAGRRGRGDGAVRVGRGHDRPQRRVDVVGGRLVGRRDGAGDRRAVVAGGVAALPGCRRTSCPACGPGALASWSASVPTTPVPLTTGGRWRPGTHGDDDGGRQRRSCRRCRSCWCASWRTRIVDALVGLGEHVRGRSSRRRSRRSCRRRRRSAATGSRTSSGSRSRTGMVVRSVCCAGGRAARW